MARTHMIPQDDPPAYTAGRQRPPGGDNISMSSVNTANTETDVDTLKGRNEDN